MRSQLALTWGVETFLVPSVEHTDEMVPPGRRARCSRSAACKEGDVRRHRRRQPARHPRLDQRAAGPPHGRRHQRLAPAYRRTPEPSSRLARRSHRARLPNGSRGRSGPCGQPHRNALTVGEGRSAPVAARAGRSAGVARPTLAHVAHRLRRRSTVRLQANLRGRDRGWTRCGSCPATGRRCASCTRAASAADASASR